MLHLIDQKLLKQLTLKLTPFFFFFFFFFLQIKGQFY